MNIEEIRDFCLSMPYVTEDCPFGPDAVTYRIGGKIFCMMDLSGHWQFYNLKCDPDYSIELRDRYECIRPGFHMNKRHWISIDINSNIPSQLERAIISHAYRQTARGLTHKLRQKLGFEQL